MPTKLSASNHLKGQGGEYVATLELMDALRTLVEPFEDVDRPISVDSLGSRMASKLTVQSRA